MRNIKGQALIETIIALPLFFMILFFILEFSFLTMAQRIHEWTSFKLARSLLPLKKDCRFLDQIEAQTILHKIPLPKDPPFISCLSSEKEVTVKISQTLYFLGRAHEIKNTFSLYR